MAFVPGLLQTRVFCHVQNENLVSHHGRLKTCASFDCHLRDQLKRQESDPVFRLRRRQSWGVSVPRSWRRGVTFTNQTNRPILVSNVSRSSNNIAEDTLPAPAASKGGFAGLVTRLVTPGPKGASTRRAVLFYAWTLLLAFPFTFLMSFLYIPSLIFDRHKRSILQWLSMVWATMSTRPFFKTEIVGTENLLKPETPVVYVANHQSFLDIYSMMWMNRAMRFVSKTSVFFFPLVGWCVFMAGHIGLRRQDLGSQRDCIRRSIDLIKRGISVVFFPEGTRSKDLRLGAFKAGAFSVADKASVPIVPLSISGTGLMMPSGQEMTLNHGTVRITIHPPITVGDRESAKDAADRAREIVASALSPADT